MTQGDAWSPPASMSMCPERGRGCLVPTFRMSGWDDLHPSPSISSLEQGSDGWCKQQVVWADGTGIFPPFVAVSTPRHGSKTVLHGQVDALAV